MLLPMCGVVEGPAKPLNHAVCERCMGEEAGFSLLRMDQGCNSSCISSS